MPSGWSVKGVGWSVKGVGWSVKEERVPGWFVKGVVGWSVGSFPFLEFTCVKDFYKQP